MPRRRMDPLRGLTEPGVRDMTFGKDASRIRRGGTA